MFLKIRSLAFMLLLMIAASGIVSSEDANANLNLNLPTTTENAMSTVPMMAQPAQVGQTPSVSGIGSGQARPNLIIGGVWQTSEDQATNQKYADALDAEYVHTYYSRTLTPYAALDKGTVIGKTLADINSNEALVADAAAEVADVWAVKQATPVQENQYWNGVVPQVEKPATTEGTVYRNIRDPSTGAIVAYVSYYSSAINGLTDERLNPSKDGVGKHYDTIYVHSGGARTAVTALLYQGVTADRLVLMSPARGDQTQKDYNKDLQQLLVSGKVKEIDVYQSETLSVSGTVSSKDANANLNLNLPTTTENAMSTVPMIIDKTGKPIDDPVAAGIWQGRVKEGDVKGNFKIIPVSEKELLGKTGTDAHIQMWKTCLNLELGLPVETVDPSQPITGSTSASIPKSLPKKEFVDSLSSPLLAPPSSETSSSATSSSATSSTTYNEVPTGPNGANPQPGYQSVGNMYVWWLPQTHWSSLIEGWDSAHPGVPPVPLHFMNGEPNTVGYDWINLPFSQTGMTYDQGYADMVRAYEASNGGFNGAAAGAGPL